MESRHCCGKSAVGKADASSRERMTCVGVCRCKHAHMCVRESLCMDIQPPPQSVQLYIAQNSVLVQLEQRCPRGPCRMGGTPSSHTCQNQGYHTCNVVSPLTVSEGLVKCFDTAQSGVQGAVIYLLTNCVVFNIKRIQNYPKIK